LIMHGAWVGGSLGSLYRTMALRDAPTGNRDKGRWPNPSRDSAHAILIRSDARALLSAVDSPKREEGKKERTTPAGWCLISVCAHPGHVT
jgi:hypothetical protein